MVHIIKEEIQTLSVTILLRATDGVTDYIVKKVTTGF
jgi:hypothetical protein